ncbi:hypothetical protein JCM11641_001266 [Rhodosporidiobolus odoratus]
MACTGSAAASAFHNAMQFEDADDGAIAAPLLAHPTPISHQPSTRAVQGAYVDDQDDLPSPTEDEDDDEETSERDDWPSEDEWNASEGLRAGLNEVLDQDWADASGDFTKRYNRMKQQVLVSHGALAGKQTSLPASARAGSVLPATNRSRRGPSANAAATKAGERDAVHTNKVSDQLAHFSRFSSRIQLEPLSAGPVTRKGGSEKVLVKDKSDRATNEQVLDPRTRLILFKMLGRGLIERIDGCVSTGKEANVYHAAAADGRRYALKIYKTSILVFKDRDRYVTGEFRFKSGYARSNPRKMVRLWAEKELRNLRRMRGAGLRVPEAIEVRENVLVMDFVGQDEWQASPRLKDANIPQDLQRSLYVEILVILRVIFARCRLVHADFSEYNILYHGGHLWVIDVSQSVEHEHPAAFDFLRADIKNADDFFSRRGVETLGLTRTFNFVTSDAGRDFSDEQIATEVERLLMSVESGEALADASNAQPSGTADGQGGGSATRPSASDEAVFARSFIPRALDQVYDAERDVARVLRGEGQGLIYADITGIASIHRSAVEGKEPSAPTASQANPPASAGGTAEDESDEEESDGDGDSEESNDGKSEEGEGDRKPRGKKFEDKEEKKQRRQDVKEKAREKRAIKMKKSEKARRIKKGSGKKR